MMYVKNSFHCNNFDLNDQDKNAWNKVTNGCGTAV